MVINLAVADVGWSSFWDCFNGGLPLKVPVFSPKILFLMFFVYSLQILKRMHVIFRQLKHRGTKKWVFKVTITALWVVPAMVLRMTVFDFGFGSSEALVFFWPIPMYNFFVCSVLSVFRALVLELNLCVERVLSTMVQLIDKENRL